MALLAFRDMGNVKACVELLLKREMVVMSSKCCSGFAVGVWLLEVLGDGSCLGKRICLQCVAAEDQETVGSPHPVPLWWEAGVEYTLNKPKPSAPSSER